MTQACSALRDACSTTLETGGCRTVGATLRQCCCSLRVYTPRGVNGPKRAPDSTAHTISKESLLFYSLHLSFMTLATRRAYTRRDRVSRAALEFQRGARTPYQCALGSCESVLNSHLFGGFAVRVVGWPLMA